MLRFRLRPVQRVILVTIGGMAVVVVGAGCGREASSGRGPESKVVPMPHHLAESWFDDITERVGLEFKHNPGATGDFLMPESIGSGGAFFDFDQDGRLDVYLVHGAPAAVGVRHQLYHQEPDGTFRNVSAGSGLDVSGPGMGVAVGDVNNDGQPDVLLTEVGRVRLFLNRERGKFTEVGEAAGLDNPRWATSASFLDYDRDGRLDVVVANYVDYSPTVRCFDSRGRLEYCGPQGMAGTVTRLFHNAAVDAGGLVRFKDVTVASGLAKTLGAALGVLCVDLTGDRWVDILLADDGMANRLFVNRHDGTFVEEALSRGLAYNALGAPAANMGIACGDVDGNGLTDLFIPHVSWEQHALWKQGPPGLFLDQAAVAGLTEGTLRGTGFGAALVDIDRDGDLDLAFVNGRIRRAELAVRFLPGMEPFWEPYAQYAQLFANDGSGRFREVSAENPALCARAAVGRGLAVGDVDNDGAPDLLVMNTGAPARLLRNVAPAKGHWLTVRAIEPALGGRDACGAEVAVVAGSRQWRRWIQPGSSYLVSHDPRAHFGLGPATTFDRIEVIWPDGSVETFPGGAADQAVTLRHRPAAR